MAQRGTAHAQTQDAHDPRITEILNGQHAITGDTSLRLGIHVPEAEKLEEQQRKTQKETNQ